MENLIFFSENATESMFEWVVIALGGLLMLLTYVRMTGNSLLRLAWAEMVCDVFMEDVKLEFYKDG